MSDTMWTRYGRLWAAVPRELGFLLPTLPIVLAGFLVTVTLLSTGFGLLVVLVGFLLVLAALFVARGFGVVELARLHAAGYPAIEPPRWDRMARREGAIAKLFAPFIDAHFWLYLLHTLVVNFVVGIVTWSVGVFWIVLGVFGVFSWIGTAFDARLVVIGQPVLGVILGLLALATLPFVLRALTLAHHGIARGMLGTFTSEALREQATAAATAEGTALRRLERDLHDGPQQRLVRLQMDLAAADRQLDADPEASRRLIGEALAQSRDALEELRSLSRGFAPPILLDRGLVAALESLADRGAVLIRLDIALPAGLRLPPELERNAYFLVTEAVTNAAKHAGATRVDVTVARRPGMLDLTVVDDGRGGARVVDGHGLAGLQERVRALGGALELTSPAGGPTLVAAHLPLPAGS